MISEVLSAPGIGNGKLSTVYGGQNQGRSTRSFTRTQRVRASAARRLAALPNDDSDTGHAGNDHDNDVAEEDNDDDK